MSHQRTKLYLLDIEGTIAPLTLTSEQLFPYARRHFEAFLSNHFTDAEVRTALARLLEENRAETDSDAPRISVSCHPGEEKRPAFLSGSLAYLLWLMDRDRKSTALKTLQGRIWKAGFASGELKGTLFGDVPGALERWSQQWRVAIYSSGSTEAQELLFRHSAFGDLTGHIAAYFDTRTGPKQSRGSYTAIATLMELAPGDVVFFSDVAAELDAAREAGCQTRLVIREGNPPVGDAHGHIRISSLDSIE